MIELVMKQTKAGEYVGFDCTGHAGYAEEGQDIICAGVSALVVSVVQSIEALTEDKFFAEADEDGDVYCTFEAPASYDATLLLNVLVIGCQSIAAEYNDPDTEKEYINVTFEEV